jgi:hypothetical protein
MTTRNPGRVQDKFLLGCQGEGIVSGSVPIESIFPEIG